jgi:hypothetical protein
MFGAKLCSFRAFRGTFSPLIGGIDSRHVRSARCEYDKCERGSVSASHCRGAYRLFGNSDLPITTEFAQALIAGLDLHGNELLLPPQPAIDIVVVSSVVVAARRRFIATQS